MKTLILYLSLFLTNCMFSQKEEDILGNWLTQDGERKINVYKQGEKYFGKIYWVKNTQKNNEIGKVIMMDLSFEETDYDEGKFLMPSEKHSASCAAKVIKTNILQIIIYHGLKLFGHTIYLSKII